MTVPARPCTASSIISNDVMTARRPPDSTNLTAASTFGPMLPLANFCSCAIARISSGVDPVQRPLVVGAVTEHHVLDVGGDHEHLRASVPREQRGREVLVDDGLDPAQRPVRVAHHRDPASAGAHHDVPGVGQGRDRGRVEHLDRLRGGDHPPPALGAAVLPDLAVLHQGAGLVLGQVATDRLGRVREAGVVPVDERSGHHSGRTPVGSAVRKRLVQRVEDQEADGALRLRAAPVQRDRRDDVRGELVLHQQVADLRAVAVGEHHVDATGHQVGDPLHRDADRAVLVLRRGTPVRPGHGVAAQGDEHSHGLDPRRRATPRPRRVARPCGRHAVRTTRFRHSTAAHGGSTSSSHARTDASCWPRVGGARCASASSPSNRSGGPGRVSRPAVACSTSTSRPCERVWSQS